MNFEYCIFSVAQKIDRVTDFFFLIAQTFELGFCLLGSIMSGGIQVSFETYLRSCQLLATHFKLLIC